MVSTNAIDWARQALQTALLLGGPALAAAFVAGLIVNVGQTLTQLHEPVVGMVCRMAAVALVLIVVLPWMLSRWVAFAVDLFSSVPDLI